MIANQNFHKGIKYFTTKDNNILLKKAMKKYNSKKKKICF